MSKMQSEDQNDQSKVKVHECDVCSEEPAVARLVLADLDGTVLDTFYVGPCLVSGDIKIVFKDGKPLRLI